MMKESEHPKDGANDQDIVAAWIDGLGLRHLDVEVLDVRDLTTDEDVRRGGSVPGARLERLHQRLDGHGVVHHS